MKKPRPISAVTSIGSFEEPIDSTKDLSYNNNNNSIRSETNNASISSKSNQIKTSRPPTVTSVVQIPNQQQTIPNNIQPVSYHCRQKPLCSKIISDQVNSEIVQK